MVQGVEGFYVLCWHEGDLRVTGDAAVDSVDPKKHLRAPPTSFVLAGLVRGGCGIRFRGPGGGAGSVTVPRHAGDSHGGPASHSVCAFTGSSAIL